jgi:hypothetical protein
LGAADERAFASCFPSLWTVASLSLNGIDDDKPIIDCPYTLFTSPKVCTHVDESTSCGIANLSLLMFGCKMTMVATVARSRLIRPDSSLLVLACDPLPPFIRLCTSSYQPLKLASTHFLPPSLNCTWQHAAQASHRQGQERKDWHHWQRTWCWPREEHHTSYCLDGDGFRGRE